jgi:dipeptidyl aminopeptidase/acylaminoacyl peptidase
LKPRSLLAALAALVALFLGTAQAAPPPIESFFRIAEFTNPVLSPDGKRLAVVITAKGGRGRLTILQLDDLSKSKGIAGFGDADVANVRWVNNHRLVYTAWDGRAERTDPIWPGLWSIDDEGKQTRHLIYSNNDVASSTGTHLVDRTLPYNWVLESTLDDGSDDVLVMNYVFDNRGDLAGTSMARLDTQTGNRRSLAEKPPGQVFGWWTDRTGHVLAVMTENKAVSELLVPEGEGWKSVSQGNAFTGAGHHFAPLSATVPDWLYVYGPDPEHKVDTTVLSRLDLKHPGAPPKVLLSLPGYDFRGSLVVDSKAGQLVGVKFETDAEGAVWLNPQMKAIQAEIDQKLPGLINQISCHACLSDETLLVSSSSDRQPPIYSIYEPAKKKLTTLINSRSWIEAEAMGMREAALYKTRDGLTIPMMVTHPAGPEKAHRPAVMLVHGGPWVRGNHWADWQWLAEAQFLASRGYVVIEPEFRGSTGYGSKLFRAGFKQWGLAMQDDISDAMDFAAAKGWIDARRVCIAGASYGGYAALMGLAKEPERYRCGFEWAGVTDINLMYSISWSDASARWQDYGMPVMIGDQVKDAAQLKATSPIELAARINKPLLLAYGGDDRRVPIQHGQEFRDAVRANNKDVEWVVYPNEGHGWVALETNIDFWGRVEKLLARTIGDGANP